LNQLYSISSVLAFCVQSQTRRTRLMLLMWQVCQKLSRPEQAKSNWITCHFVR